MDAKLMNGLDNPKSTRDFRIIFRRVSVVRESISESGLERVDA